MRTLRSMLISGWVVLLLLATAGFAAYSTRGAAEPTTVSAATVAPVALPAVSGRVSAFILAEALAGPTLAAPQLAATELAPAPDAAPTTAPTTTSSSTSTTIAETTTTAAPASTITTTTTAPTTTTTTVAPATTAAPTTTEAATTTTEATTTTLPATGTTEVNPQEPASTTTVARASGGATQWRGLVSAYFPVDLVEEALVVMQCESRGDPAARNPYSGAAGLFQFMPRTWSWASEGAGFAGADVYDAEANIASAAWLVDYSLATGHEGGAWGHWNCKP